MRIPGGAATVSGELLSIYHWSASGKVKAVMSHKPGDLPWQSSQAFHAKVYVGSENCLLKMGFFAS